MWASIRRVGDPADLTVEVTVTDERYTVGVDFGTLSGRAVVVRASDGTELGTAVHEYAHAVMDTRLTAGPAAATDRHVTLPPVPR